MFTPTQPLDTLAFHRRALDDEDPAAISTWASRHPCIPATSSWDELVCAIQGHSSDGRRLRGNNQAFHALLTIHADGDPRAGQVVLQAMYPLMASSFLKLRYQHASAEDAISAIIAAMWTVICTFPLHRPSNKTLANLSGEFKKNLCGTKAPQRQSDLAEVAVEPEDLAFWEAPAFANTLTDSPHSIEDALFPSPSEAGALDLLASAFDAGALSHEETKLLIDLYIEETPRTEVAARLQISPVLLRQRKCRALKKLKSWAISSF